MLAQLDGHEEKPLDIAIADMSSVLRPGLSIIDGTIGMEGLGPSAGSPKALDVVLGGCRCLRSGFACMRHDGNIRR